MNNLALYPPSRPYNSVARGCSSVDRVLASEAKGRGFDPRQPRHVSQRHPSRWRFSFAGCEMRRSFEQA